MRNLRIYSQEIKVSWMTSCNFICSFLVSTQCCQIVLNLFNFILCEWAFCTLSTCMVLRGQSSWNRVLDGCESPRG